MSENRARYTTNPEGGLTLDQIAALDCARVFEDPRYRPPTPEEITGLIKAAGWSQREAANVVGASSNEKGSTTIRKWRAPVSSREHREIPYAAWRLMLISAGVVDQVGLRAVAEG